MGKNTLLTQVERETLLAQWAIENLDAYFLECTDCCWMERVQKLPRGLENPKCPECNGKTLIGIVHTELKNA
jgi:hypothetical protein